MLGLRITRMVGVSAVVLVLANIFVLGSLEARHVTIDLLVLGWY